MAEYIEREKAFDAVFGQFCASSDETEAALNAAIEEIRAVPAADVVPVVHGRWVHIASDEWKCSECSYGVLPWNNGQNYCPNCGAKMDGGGE